MSVAFSAETYEKLKDILGLPDNLIKCSIHLATDSLITITDCEFYAYDKVETKVTDNRKIVITIDGKNISDIFGDAHLHANKP